MDSAPVTLLSGRWHTDRTLETKERIAAGLRAAAARRRGEPPQGDEVTTAWAREHPGSAWWDHEAQVRQQMEAAIQRWRTRARP